MYCKEYPECKDVFSLFCNLQPKNVLLLGDTPKNQCKCKVHETYLKLEAMDYSYDRYCLK